MYKLLSPVEYVVDLLSDVSSKAEKFPVNSMQDGFEKIPLTWIFTIKQLQQLYITHHQCIGHE